MSGDELPSARAAMLEAVRKAEAGFLDGARLWLDIARELRIGETARPLPRPLDAGVTPEQYIEKTLAATPLAPWEAPEERPEDTAVIRYVPAADGPVSCGQAGCGQSIELHLPDGRNGYEGWVHTLTQQRVCLISDPVRGHTFATPAVDVCG